MSAPGILLNRWLLEGSNFRVLVFDSPSFSRGTVWAGNQCWMVRASEVHTTTLTYWHREKCPRTWLLRWHAQTRAWGAMVSPVTTEVCPWVFIDLLCSRTPCSPKGEFLTPLLNFQHLSLPSVWGNENSRDSRVWAGVESQSRVISLIYKLVMVNIYLVRFCENWRQWKQRSQSWAFGRCSLISS